MVLTTANTTNGFIYQIIQYMVLTTANTTNGVISDNTIYGIDYS